MRATTCPALKFGVDVDLVGLQPAVAVTDAGGELRLQVFPPEEAAAARGQKHRDQPDRESQPPPAADVPEWHRCR